MHLWIFNGKLQECLKQFLCWNFNISFGKYLHTVRVFYHSSENHSREGVSTNAGLVCIKGSMLNGVTKDGPCVICRHLISRHNSAHSYYISLASAMKFTSVCIVGMTTFSLRMTKRFVMKV